MKVIIVRHAQTTENVKTQDIDYDTEALLTEQGILQAQKLGEYLKGEKISYAYASPQKRAIHTAEKILHHHHSIKIEVVERLSEQNLGVAESFPKHAWKEIKKNTKEAWHLFKAEKGESYAELQERVREFFNSLIHKHKNDTVLIVSHGGTLGVLLLDILGKELTQENYRAHQPKNTEFTIVEFFADGKKHIHALNNRTHLDG